MNVKLPSAQTRQWAYRVILAAIPLLVVVGLIAPEQVGLWLGLAAAILGIGATGLANTALSQQRQDGTIPPPDAPPADPAVLPPLRRRAPKTPPAS